MGALNNQFPLNLSQGDILYLYKRDYGFYLDNMYSLSTMCGYPTYWGFDREY